MDFKHVKHIKGKKDGIWLKTRCPFGVKFIIETSLVGGFYCTEQCQYFSRVESDSDKEIIIECKYIKT